MSNKSYVTYTDFGAVGDGVTDDFEAILRAVKYDMKIVEMPVKIINHRESKVRMIRDTIKMLGDLNRMKRRIKNEKE